MEPVTVGFREPVDGISQAIGVAFRQSPVLLRDTWGIHQGQAVVARLFVALQTVSGLQATTLASITTHVSLR